jgi:4-amino-4-deoxy-L-arabinose transferase-like glycosyltransferase
MREEDTPRSSPPAGERRPPRRTDRWWTAARIRGFDGASLAVAAILVVVAAFLLLTGLGDQPLAMWDEARLAVNAFEMHAARDPIVTRFAGAPDLWNTKPPLAIWLQAVLLGVVDPPELAVRLPAALATIGTVLLVFGFLRRELGEVWPGALAGLVLLGTPAFIGYHAGRSGDYDSLLVFWTTLYSIGWYRYCRTGGGSALAVFGGGLALAMLTKGVAGLLMTPGLLLFTALEGRLGGVLRERRAWITVAAALAVPLAWYAVREWTVPGYLAAMLANEPGSFFGATDGTRADPFYLLRGMLDRRLEPWVVLLPVSLLLVWPMSAPLARWATCLLAGFFLVAESSSTKLSWYDLPSYPVIAMVIGVAVSGLLSRACAALLPRRRWPVPLAIAALTAIPLVDSARDVLAIDWRTDTRLDYGEAFRRAGDGALTVLDGGIANSAGLRNYNAALQFYADRARARGRAVRIVHPGYRFGPGEAFLTCDPEALAAAKARFRLSGEARVGPCVSEVVTGELSASSASAGGGVIR